ncbi:MAG: hypothetical protein WCR42_04750 [bacterium]
MKILEANITNKVHNYLKDVLMNIVSLEMANKIIFDFSGITSFFDNSNEFQNMKEIFSLEENIHEVPDRTQYGDFQTNTNLAEKIVLDLVLKNITPEILIEPTCGKGNFIIASLNNFQYLKKVYGIEIYKPYIWETKFHIINFYIENHRENKPEITISHCNVFDFDFKNIAKKNQNNEILVLGNPPWVTNAKLGSLSSLNLPKKTNFKNHSGLDAMTGKGNFDIAESITAKMLDAFQNMKGHLLLIVKNSVIKNIIFDQKIAQHKISSIENIRIDSKKEFNVSVEASLFFCQLNSKPQFICKEYDFYLKGEHYLKFGWIGDKFVSDIDNYALVKSIDGESPFIWRQGLKHDCSAIMELDKVDGYYTNGINEKVNLEDDLVYGFLKSSDLKNTVINRSRKFTIVTQRKVGQETAYIKSSYPKTYQYLNDHKKSFDSRKSSIYKNKPTFSIFGIGDYSFKPYKVAISGLYKTFHFTLVLPQDNKPVMLDDTCYLLGFDKIEFAIFALILLNSDMAMQFLQSVTFADAKRRFTKDVLMRIDLLEVAKILPKKYLETELSKINSKYELDINLLTWNDFIEEMTPVNFRQTELF